MTTYILGINCVYHESSVALLRVEKAGLHLVAFVEEERFSRIKRAKPALIDNSDALPRQALDWVLSYANLTMESIAHIATSLNPEKRKQKNSAHQHEYALPTQDFGTPEGEQIFFDQVRKIEAQCREMGFRGRFHFIDHHLCHSASSFHASGFPDAVSVVVDGIGEFSSLSVFDCENGKQKPVYALDYPHSLGFLWEKLSAFVGFSEYDAGKTMGMAAFGGRRILEDGFAKFASLTEEPFQLEDAVIQFRSGSHAALEKALGIPRHPRPISELNYNTLIYFDLAAALQDFTEKALLRLVRKAIELTGKKNLCLSGGVALNCVANQKILETGLFEKVFIQPASNDAGTALGAALVIAAKIAPAALQQFRILSPYTPVAFEESAYQSVLEQHRDLTFTRSENIYAEAARLIANGGIIAWFEGGMEIGPRALGHRSILADPRNIHTLKNINDRVKLREVFRPLAPAVLKEKAQEWFEIADQWIEQDNSPYLYMLATTQVRPDKKHLIPSVVHYDDTARVQIVDKDLSPGFYRLIEAFEKLTGVPIVTNTSFNIQEPIVCTPQDAINTFLRSNMAALVLGDYLIRRKEERAWVEKIEKAAAHASNGSSVNGRHVPQIISGKRAFSLVQQPAKNGYEITRGTPIYHAHQLPKLLDAHRSTEGFCLPVVTDAIEYKGIDQVFPLQPEQIFFMDYLDVEAVRDSHFMEIGLGSGVLSIFCLLQGAQRGVGLDINPRAKLFTGFNALLNGVEDRLEIRDGNVSAIFSPVAGEQFDLIISNPPFEPTPPGMDYYLNSSAGIYGLNFVEALLKDAGRHLKQNSLFQMVTMAPGNEHEPFMLVDLIRRYLPNQPVELTLDRQPIRYDDFVERFVRIFGQDPAVIQQMKNKAKNDGVTHLHMLILKYRKGRGGNLEIRPAKKVYETWSSPLGTEVNTLTNYLQS